MLCLTLPHRRTFVRRSSSLGYSPPEATALEKHIAGNGYRIIETVP